jgi:ferredoxin
MIDHAGSCGEGGLCVLCKHTILAAEHEFLTQHSEPILTDTRNGKPSVAFDLTPNQLSHTSHGGAPGQDGYR